MSVKKNKVEIILTTLLAFSLGLILLLLSKHYLTDDNEPWKTVFALLGAYLTISIVANLFHRWFLKPSEDETRKQELEILLDERINAILGNSVKYGFSGFLPEMNYKAMFDALENGDVLWWVDTYCPAHQLWESNIRNAISRGAEIKMLVLSANTDYAIDRANEIGGTYTPERFKKELKNFKEALEIIQKASETESGSLEITEYTDRPGMPVYLVAKKDGSILGYSSFYVGKPTGAGFPHMRWTTAEGGFVNELLEYVKAKWERNVLNSASSESE